MTIGQEVIEEFSVTGVTLALASFVIALNSYRRLSNIYKPQELLDSLENKQGVRL
jgi:hypothetical protein